MHYYSMKTPNLVAHKRAAPGAKSKQGSEREGAHSPRSQPRTRNCAVPGVRFDRVCCRVYGATALEKLDFEIHAGSTVALVGACSLAKQACADLVARRLVADNGRVVVGGHDIRYWSETALRQTVSLVPRGVSRLPALSVVDSIRLGRESASQEEVEAVARRARLHDFIADLPHGYLTSCHSEGWRFTAVERQQLALARAMLFDAPVLIVDELETQAARDRHAALDVALREARQGRTTLVIARRLSTAQDADEVIVLEGGRAFESGSHDDLIRWNDRYARLVRLNALV